MKDNKRPYIYLDYWPDIPCVRCGKNMDKDIYLKKNCATIYYYCSQSCGGSAHIHFTID